MGLQLNTRMRWHGDALRSVPEIIARNPRFLMHHFGQKTGFRARMSRRRMNEIESGIPCSARNPRIQINRFCLQTAFRARMRIFKSGISGSGCYIGLDALFFCKIVARWAYNSTHAWDDMAMRCYRGFDALFFCKIVARWVYLYAHMRDDMAIRCYSGVWGFVLL